MAVRLDALKATREAAGLTIGQLAHLSNTSDLIIHTLENVSLNGTGNGGTCQAHVADRIIDALGSDRATVGFTDVG